MPGPSHHILSMSTMTNHRRDLGRFGVDLPRLAGIVAAACLILGPSLAEAAVTWHTDLGRARGASQVSRRPVLLLFTATWSEASANLVEKTLAEDGAAAILAACFEPVRIDVDAQADLTRRFAVDRVPCGRVLGLNDEVLASFDCPTAPSDFVAAAARAAQEAAVANHTPHTGGRSDSGLAGTNGTPTRDVTGRSWTTSASDVGLAAQRAATDRAAQPSSPVASKVQNLSSFGNGTMRTVSTSQTPYQAPYQPPSVSPWNAPQATTSQPQQPVQPVQQPVATAAAAPRSTGSMWSAQPAAAAPQMAGAGYPQAASPFTPQPASAQPGQTLPAQTAPSQTWSGHQLAGPQAGLPASPTPPTAAVPAQPAPTVPEKKSGNQLASFMQTLPNPFRKADRATPAAAAGTTATTPAVKSPAVGGTATASAPPSEEGTGPMPLGLEGYCPVTLAERGSWAEGRAQWGARHRGRTYLFAGPEQQKAFLADPDRYAPALSGDDAVVALETGKSTPGQRRYGVVCQSRVYLFSSPETRDTFAANPDRYTGRIAAVERPQTAGAAQRY